MSALCPNNTSGVLWHVFHFSPAQRQALFFGVCVPLRLAVAYVAYKYLTLIPLLVVLSAVSALKLATDLRQANPNPTARGQWWSKPWQLMVAVSIVLSFWSLPKRSSKRVVPFLLAAGVLGGVVQALMVGFC
jgi:hypothetical protein